jgi:hypothetical protein
VAALLRLLDVLAAARAFLAHPIRYAGRVRLAPGCLHAREAAPPPSVADGGRLPLHVQNGARAAEEAAALERFRSLRSETGALEKAAALLFALGQVLEPRIPMSTWMTPKEKDRKGGNGACAEAFAHARGGIGFVAHFLPRIACRPERGRRRRWPEVGLRR